MPSCRPRRCSTIHPEPGRPGARRPAFPDLTCHRKPPIIPFLLSLLLLPCSPLQVVPTGVQVQRRALPSTMPDCNGNGIPDSWEIASGLVQDCQGDGIPDECQLAEPYKYAYDDGQMNGSVGTDQPHVAWLTHHVVVAGLETVTGIELAWGLMPSGTPATLGLWSDPDGDGDPADAQLLVGQVAYAQFPQTGIVVLEDVPDTYIGPAGTSFFVGAWGEFAPSPANYPGPLDDNSTTFESWWITSNTPIDPNDLSSGAVVEYGLVGASCPCNGDWMIRALACLGGHCGESVDLNGNEVPDECEDCDGNGIPDDLDIAAGTASDCDGDGIPDLCVLPDCDGNGLADLCQELAGHGLVGEYYANKSLAGAPVSRIDDAVFFDFKATPPFPGAFPSTDFSVRWTGAITTAAAGTYTFGVNHDRGARLWVNGVKLVDDWWDGGGFDAGSVFLEAATEYYIRLEYFAEDGANEVELFWQPPGGSLVPMLPSDLQPMLDRDDDGIPDNCQFADCNGNGVEDAVDILLGTAVDCDGNGVPDSCQPCEDCDGNGLLDSCELAAGNELVGQYWDSQGGAGNFSERLLTRIDPNIDFDWAGGTPGPGLPADEFAVRWTGTLVAPAVSGLYGLHLQADDGVRLWLDGQLLVDEWHPSSGNVYDVDVMFAADSAHLFELDYYEAGGDARVFLRWTVPGQAEAVVPTTAFLANTDLNGDTVPDLCTQDCNLNGVPDQIDIQLGALTDADGDCIPDECEGGTGYWRFEESGGATVLDETGNGLHGTLNAWPVRVETVPVAVVPQTGQPDTLALDLNWQDILNGGVISVPDAGSLLSFGDSNFTLEAWVKLEALGTTFGAGDRQWLFQKKPAAASDALLDYGFLVQSGDLGTTGRELAFRYGNGVDAHNVVSTLRIDDLGWHHVSLAHDAAAHWLRFGLDGVFESMQLKKPDVAAFTPLLIGAHENQSAVKNQFVRGLIDEVRVTRAFLPEEDLLNETP